MAARAADGSGVRPGSRRFAGDRRDDFISPVPRACGIVGAPARPRPAGLLKPAHNVTRANDFRSLTALLRYFFHSLPRSQKTSFPAPPVVGAGNHRDRFASGVQEAKNGEERRESFRRTKSLRSEIGDLFVFNGLTGISIRAVSASSRWPRARKAPKARLEVTFAFRTTQIVSKGFWFVKSLFAAAAIGRRKIALRQGSAAISGPVGFAPSRRNRVPFFCEPRPRQAVFVGGPTQPV